MPTAELTLPDNLETATAMLNDPAEINRWLQARRLADLQARFNELDRPPLAQQVADILDAREAQNGSVATAARQAMQEVLREHGVANAVNRPNPGVDTSRLVVRNEYARRIEEIGFANIGDFVKELWHKNPVANRLPDVRKVMNDFSSVDPSLGGVLLPESLDSEIRSLMLEESFIRRLATVVTMTAPTMLFPFVDWTTNVGSTFGGWTVQRVGEGGDITPSNAKFGRASLTATKQVAGARIPNEMFADVSALDGFIRQTLPQAMAFEESNDFLNGTGVGEPLGILKSPARIVVDVTLQAADTIITENVVAMYARMLPSSKRRAVWVTNPTTFSQLQLLTINVGTGGAPIALVNIANSPVPTMLGRPIIESELVPPLGEEGDLSFLDPSYYLIGDRPGSGLETSPHPEFMNDITVVRLIARNDGRPWIQSAIQPRNGDTLSPFVVLGERTGS